MKQSVWRKHHKWFGLIAGFFLVMFCWSGIVLNHRDVVSGCEVSRGLLPNSYQFKNWNCGLVRGELMTSDGRTFIYGNSGIWTKDSAGGYEEINGGFPSGVDNRNIRSMSEVEAIDEANHIFALSANQLYRLDAENKWNMVDIGSDDERMSDMTFVKDTLVIVGRSHIYTSVYPFSQFHKSTLKASEEYDGKTTLFKTIWMLHSGEMFGIVGKIVMDIVAVVLILIYVTGVVYWFLVARSKRLAKTGRAAQNKAIVPHIRRSYNWHDFLGRKTIILTIFVCLTGWCLRPPLMVLGVLTRVPAIPHTELSDPNPWNDKLRAIRFDQRSGDWLLSTSEGFHSLENLGARPVKLENTPPVSVMGVNVLRNDSSDGYWTVGSFSGLFKWDRLTGKSVDYFTGLEPEIKKGIPIGDHDICGWMNGPVEYTAGTDVEPMPDKFCKLPMSLWNVALEVHTGRIYTFMGILSTLLWVFLAGAAALWAIWTGWKIRRKSR